jgi:nicotinamidase-related amidase
MGASGVCAHQRCRERRVWMCVQIIPSGHYQNVRCFRQRQAAIWLQGHRPPVVVKNFPNSFLKTNLKELLDQHGIKEVTVIGAMSHMCIDATTRAASDFGYNATVVHDACATLDLEFRGTTVPAAQVHAALMAALAYGYASVVSTSEYLAS